MVDNITNIQIPGNGTAESKTYKIEPEPVIKTYGVTKRYGMNFAVNNVSMTVRKGDIYGFIGSNGAGKTTFIRLVMGLIEPTAGNVELFGKSGRAELIKARAKIGCIVETPSLMLNMNAYDCLNTQRLLYGIADKARINELLELVGLAGTGKKYVSNFSLGMKQRLSIAQALLNRPEILILDEPTNGMDPQGIVEMRNMLKRFRDYDGITILVSSHILSELQQLATRFGIISDGVLVDEFSQEQFLMSRALSLIIKASDVQNAVKLMNECGCKFSIDNQTGYIRLKDASDFAAINKKLVMAGIDIDIIEKGTYSLEEYFIDKVNAKTMQDMTFSGAGGGTNG